MISSAVEHEFHSDILKQSGFNEGLDNFFRDLVEKGRVRRPADEQKRGRERKAFENAEPDAEPAPRAVEPIEEPDIEIGRQDDIERGGFEGGFGEDMPFVSPPPISRAFVADD